MTKILETKYINYLDKLIIVKKRENIYELLDESIIDIVVTSFNSNFSFKFIYAGLDENNLRYLTKTMSKEDEQTVIVSDLDELWNKIITKHSARDYSELDSVETGIVLSYLRRGSRSGE